MAAAWLAVAAACAPQMGMRINKVFTATFSRREADRIVASGRVAINGKRASNGDRVLLGDAVTLDGAPFALPVAAELNNEDGNDANNLYLKYWKPRGVTCTTDQRIEGNIIEALAFPGPERLFPVGRLDKDSEGLILLTNDGRLPNAINRAKFAHGKLYEVECHRPLSDSHLRQLANGVVITTTAQRDRGPPKILTAPTLPCTVRRLDERAFEITLTEGRNRQIRRMCKAIGSTVTRLHRTSVLGIGLDGLDGPGVWAHLDGDDLGLVEGAIDGARLLGVDDAGDAISFGEEEDGRDGDGYDDRPTSRVGGYARDGRGGRGGRAGGPISEPRRPRSLGGEVAPLGMPMEGARRPATRTHVDTWSRYRRAEAAEGDGHATSSRRGGGTARGARGAGSERGGRGGRGAGGRGRGGRGAARTGRQY